MAGPVAGGLLLRLELPGRGPVWGRHVPALRDEVELLSGDPLAGSAVPTGQCLPLAWQAWEAGSEGRPRLLCPTVPSKIVAVGSNYHDHAREMGKPLPAEPVLFLKPPSALCRPGQAIVRPQGVARVDYEGELALVIGRRMHRVTEQDALSYVLGYTALNDVTARDLQRVDGQFARAKGFDTFCPLGPALVTDLTGLVDGSIWLRTRRNGAVVQDSSRDRFLFGPACLLAFISHIMTLEPGDVVSTGTPAGVGPLEPGDVVEVEVAGLPPLRNPVIEGPPPLRLGRHGL
ncbi:MAG: fumarylacetoacetate hydrolase family protein [Myxococcales bacterium]|nr:fumarylacetoacetate hydrolase family protein [Myxococcales bacterium]